ncbi:hypothetical protein HDV00_001675 [Rhizophlyctis rosea]|nr:hypothetical protein HDV00_001675 [Rhizophlyctis rosea]
MLTEMDHVPITCLCDLPSYGAPKSKTISDLPLEILEHAFSFLAFEDQLPVLPQVCKAFQIASGDIRHLNILSNLTALRLTLPTILSHYPRLTSLHILAPAPTPTTSYRSTTLGISYTSHVHQLHALARQFVGHTTLRSIECASDHIIPGALQCPKLVVLKVPFGQGYEEDAGFEDEDMGGGDGLVVHFEHHGTLDTEDEHMDVAVPNIPATSQLAPAAHGLPLFLPSIQSDRSSLASSRARLNLVTILRQAPFLKHLEIHDPSFWTRSSAISTASDCHPALQTLKINTISTWPLRNMIDFFSSTDTLHALSNLKLELDYHHLPEDAVRALGAGSPNLKRLKLKYAILPPGVIEDVAQHLKQLESISLGKCVVVSNCADGWRGIIEYWAQELPGLKAIGFSACNLRIEGELLEIKEDEGLQWKYLLKSLKIFDTGDYRPTLGDLEAYSALFPGLEVLRVDAPWNCLLPDNLHAWMDMDRKMLAQINRLEVRCARPWAGDTDEPAFSERPTTISAKPASSSVIFLPKLTSLSIWSPPTLPLPINLTRLQHLKINFPPCGLPPPTPPYDLPSLRTLEIHGLAPIGHTTLLSLLPIFTTNARNLTSLHIEVLCRTSAALPVSTLRQLTQTCPHLRHLHISNFTLPPDTFAILTCAFPQLTSLHLLGPSALPTYISLASIAPFISAHPHLKALNLSVAGLLTVGGDVRKEVCAVGGFRYSVGDEPGGRNHRIVNTERYAEFARSVRRRFWWIKEVHLIAPS